MQALELFSRKFSDRRNKAQEPPLYTQDIISFDVEVLVQKAMGYHYGANYVSRDFAKAKILYKRAFIAGNADAINILGVLLHYGADGVGKDVLKAKEL